MNKGERKNVITSFFVDSIGNFLVQILMIVVVPVYLSYVSEVHYGYWLTILSIIAWITLTDLGIGMALTRELIDKIANNSNQNLINRVISTGFFTFSLLGILFFFIGFGLLFFLPSWLNIPLEDLGLFNTTYSICIISGTLVLPLKCFSAIIEANKKLTLNRTISLLSAISGLVIGVGLIIFTEAGVVVLALGMLIKVLFQGGVAFFYSLKIQDYNLKLKHFDKPILKTLFSFGGYLQISRIANTVAVSADNIIITSLMGAFFVTPYNLTVKLASFFGLAIASKIPIALFPSITNMVVKEQVKKLQRLVNNMLILLTRLSLFAGCLVYFINEDFVTLWVGSENFGGSTLNLIFVYWILFETIVRGTTMIIYAYGELKQLAIFSIFEAVSNLLLSFILGRMMGLVGVALATAISRTFTIGLYLPYFLWKKGLIDRNSLKLILKIILLSIPMILVVFLVSYIEVNQLFLSIALIGVVTVITNMICFDYKELGKVLRREISLIQLPKEILKKYAV